MRGIRAMHWRRALLDRGVGTRHRPESAIWLRWVSDVQSNQPLNNAGTNWFATRQRLDRAAPPEPKAESGAPNSPMTIGLAGYASSLKFFVYLVHRKGVADVEMQVHEVSA